MKITQTEQVIKHLRLYGKITSWDAFREYGITRLSARIYNLRESGFNIKSEKKTTTTRLGNKTTYAEYTLVL